MKQLSRSTSTKPSFPEAAKRSTPRERISAVEASSGPMDHERLAGTLPPKLMLMIRAPLLTAWLIAAGVVAASPRQRTPTSSPTGPAGPAAPKLLSGTPMAAQTTPVACHGHGDGQLPSPTPLTASS